MWRYNGEPIWHERTAQKLLDKMSAEIDDGTFNIKTYLPDRPLSLNSYSDNLLMYARLQRKCIGHASEEQFNILERTAIYAISFIQSLRCFIGNCLLLLKESTHFEYIEVNAQVCCEGRNAETPTRVPVVAE